MKLKLLEEIMVRTFHPIGQGAFYSEKHKNFNVVYDCGEWKNSKEADEVVKKAFDESEDIDVLFISHFDYDHICKIKTLREKTRKIKRVVLPLLHENEKLLLNFFHKVLGKTDVLKLIENPESFFEKETVIISISPKPPPDSEVVERKVQDIDEISQSTVIDSGTILKKSFMKSYDWVYIPYNFEYRDRNAQLEALLEEDCEDSIKAGKIPYEPKEIKKIKDIYRKVRGTINQNSMVVYSGPPENSKFMSLFPSYSLTWIDSFSNEKVGCVYTGDCDLQNIGLSLRDVYEGYWDNVGTIQIPHHGDEKSFDYGLVIGGYFCPISFGRKNPYNHPSSKVVKHIRRFGNCPIFVTEGHRFVESITLT